MATSVVFNLIDALLQTFTTALPNVKVYDGMGVSDEVGDSLLIGVDDPDADSYADSAEVSQIWSGTGSARVRYEDGTITCCAVSWNGDNNQKAARDGVKTTTAAVEAALRADPNLSGTVPGLQWVEFGGEGARFNLSQLQSDAGAAALGFFQLHFKSRI